MTPEVYNAVVEQAELEDEADIDDYKNIGLTTYRLRCHGLRIRIE